MRATPAPQRCQIALLTEGSRSYGAPAKLSEGNNQSRRGLLKLVGQRRPSCLPDQEGQRPLSCRHRTARTPPLARLQAQARAETSRRCISIALGPSRRVRTPSILLASGGTQPVSQYSRRSSPDAPSAFENRQDGHARRRAVRPLRRHDGAWHCKPGPIRDPALTLPAYGRIRRALVRRGQESGRLHQARVPPVELAILACRADRPADPAALPRLQDDIHNRYHGPSTDQENQSDSLGTFAASCALTISAIPFLGPIGPCGSPHRRRVRCQPNSQ